MDHGVIVQSGAPRAVFNAPATAFIARFMGGHNVIRAPEGAIAVRADRCRIIANPNAPAGATPGIAGPVTSIEYLGAQVKVGVRAEGEAGEMIALLPDDQYFAAPLQTGAEVRLVWAAEDAQPLSA
jgi:putative spermidine/putrescine transport system ATP-binding protein